MKIKAAIVMITLPLLIVVLYKAKSRLGINLIQGPHTPVAIEKWTGIDMSWLDKNWFKRGKI